MESNEQNSSEVPRTLAAFLRFLWARIVQTKKWWLVPFYVVLVALAIALFLSGNGALLPAIYLAL